MLGKTFKGLTDAMLAWQTERLQALAVRERGIVVEVRPELVVEVAFDGVQTSPRYPGGVALRFARVLRYREDKPAVRGGRPRRGARAARLSPRRCRPGATPPGDRPQARGRRTSKLVPDPVGSSRRLPPQRSAVALAMGRPRPAPGVPRRSGAR